MRRAEKRGANMREGGFTLLELLVAIGVLTVGLLAVATMQSTAIQGNLLGYRYTEAANLAQDRMEYLLTVPYTDALWDNGNHTDPLTTPANYTINYVIDDFDVTGGAASNAKKITVTVQLTDKGFTRTTVLNYVRPEVF